MKVKMFFVLFLITALAPFYCYSQSRNMFFFFEFETLYSDRAYQNKMKGSNRATSDLDIGFNKNMSKLIYDRFNAYYKNIEKPAWGYGASVGVLRKYERGFALKYGIGYYKLNEKLELTRKVATYKFGGLIVPIYKSNLIYFNNFHYSSLLIGLQYYITENDRLSLSITLNPKIDLLLSSEIGNYYRNGGQVYLKKHSAEISNLVINGSLGCFFIYRLTDKMHASIHPSFVRNITPSIQYQSLMGGIEIFHINQINYWYSINFGLLIPLNKKEVKS